MGTVSYYTVESVVPWGEKQNSCLALLRKQAQNCGLVEGNMRVIGPFHWPFSANKKCFISECPKIHFALQSDEATLYHKVNGVKSYPDPFKNFFESGQVTQTGPKDLLA